MWLGLGMHVFTNFIFFYQLYFVFFAKHQRETFFFSPLLQLFNSAEVWDNTPGRITVQSNSSEDYDEHDRNRCFLSNMYLRCLETFEQAHYIITSVDVSQYRGFLGNIHRSLVIALDTRWRLLCSPITAARLCLLCTSIAAPLTYSTISEDILSMVRITYEKNVINMGWQ